MKTLKDSGGEETSACYCCQRGEVPCIQEIADRGILLVLMVLTSLLMIVDTIP